MAVTAQQVLNRLLQQGSTVPVSEDIIEDDYLPKAVLELPLFAPGIAYDTTAGDAIVERLAAIYACQSLALRKFFNPEVQDSLWKEINTIIAGNSVSTDTTIDTKFSSVGNITEKWTEEWRE